MLFPTARELSFETLFRKPQPRPTPYIPSTKESISSSGSAAPPKARPKPKPLFKGAPAAVAPPAAGDSSVIESYSGMTASERVKMRSRGALQPSTPDLISTPATRMPVSSSEIPSRPPFPYASSLLPASDVLPLSTATTHQAPDDDDFVLPIVTLTTSVVSSLSVSVSKTQKLTIKLKPPKPPSSDRLDGFYELDDRGGGMASPRLPTSTFPVDPGLSSPSTRVAVLFAQANLAEN
ncbi:hypothetical protein B0H14DRAFT_3740317 [Mycena olivaceomarginata]|nr:hypothetical protein B0H14DRAFT_3740317 [Mycena olivaceomarginata]